MNKQQHQNQYEQFENSIISIEGIASKSQEIQLPSLSNLHKQKNPLINYSSTKILSSNILLEIDKKNIQIHLSKNNNKRGSIMQLFSSFEQNEDNQFIELIQENYRKEQLAFVGVIGSKGTDKSLLCDTILNLVGIKGNNYCRNHSNRNKTGIFIWSEPFRKNNLCIFILEVNTDDDSQQNIIKKLIQLVGIWVVMDQQTVTKIEDIYRKQQSNKMLPEHIHLVSHNNQIYHYKQQLNQIFPPISIHNIPIPKISIKTMSSLNNNNKLGTSSIPPTGSSFNLINSKINNNNNNNNSYIKLSTAQLHQLPTIALCEQYREGIKQLLAIVIEQIEDRMFYDGKLPLTGKMLCNIYQVINSKGKIPKTQYNYQLAQALQQQVNHQYHKYFQKASQNYLSGLSSHFPVQEYLPKQQQKLYSLLKQHAQRAIIFYEKCDPNFLDLQLRHKYYEQLQQLIDQKQNQYIKYNQKMTVKALEKWFKNKKIELNDDKLYMQRLQYDKMQWNHGRDAFVNKQIKNIMGVNKKTIDNQKIQEKQIGEQSQINSSRIRISKVQKLRSLERIKQINLKINNAQIELNRIKYKQKTPQLSYYHLSDVYQKKLQKTEEELNQELNNLVMQLNYLAPDRSQFTEKLQEAKRKKVQAIGNSRNKQKQIKEQIYNIRKDTKRRKSRDKKNKIKQFCGMKL